MMTAGLAAVQQILTAPPYTRNRFRWLARCGFGITGAVPAPARVRRADTIPHT